MKVIREHIKTGNFRPFYLLYGSESYLKKLYKGKLKEAILSGSDEMNYSYFEGKQLDLKRLVEIAGTLPFFSERRLIIIENSGLFKSSNTLADDLADMPSSTFVVFVEQEIDKRNKLYKLVRDKGVISEMNGLEEKSLKIFIAQKLAEDQKKMKEITIEYLLDKVGSDMENLLCECEKLVSYAYERDIITEADIDTVCTTQITGKIFALVEAIALKQQDKAMNLYYDLLSLREKPLSILYLIIRQFNIILQVKSMSAVSIPSGSIASKLGIPPFAVTKSMNQARNFSSKQLLEAMQYGTEVEEMAKTGRIDEQIGVEMFIVRFSHK